MLICFAVVSRVKTVGGGAALNPSILMSPTTLMSNDDDDDDEVSLPSPSFTFPSLLSHLLMKSGRDLLMV